MKIKNTRRNAIAIATFFSLSISTQTASAATVTVKVKAQDLCAGESICVKTDQGEYQTNFFALSKAEKSLIESAAKNKGAVCLTDVTKSGTSNFFEHVQLNCSTAVGNPNANASAGARKLVAAYKRDGISGAQSAVDSCYKKLDKQANDTSQLKQFEYCAGMDLAAYQLDDTMSKQNGWPPADYFTFNMMTSRVDRLSRYISDPALLKKTVQAWATLAAEAVNK